MSRPVLKIQPEPFDLLLEVLAFTGFILLIGLPALNYADLPARIPTHFGPDGSPDDYGPRSMIFLLPGMGLILYAVLSILNRYPHLFNYTVVITEENALFQYQNATRMIRVLKGVVMFTFAYLVYGTIQTAMGRQEGLGERFLIAFLALLAGAIGYFLVKAVKGR